MKKRGGWILGYTLTIFAALALVHGGSRAVTAVSEQLPIPRKQCIIIDPGHGGVDGGATSCTGILESSYNLEISLKLRDLLHFMGYKTKITRTKDESIHINGNTISEKKRSDLKERVRIVNETENGILISIHQNQFKGSQSSGAQVFYADTIGSKDLARIIQQSLARNLTPATRRKIKKCTGVYLMNHIHGTGILIECGFISNPQEAMRLQDPKYQKKLCGVIAAALGDFLG